MSDSNPTMMQLSDLHCALSMLVKPADEGTEGELHDILELNIKNALSKLNIEDLSALKSLQDIKCSVSAKSSVRWKFVCVTLHIMLSMKDCLKELASNVETKAKEGSKAPHDVLSVSQQKNIRTCLQFVVSMGMLPSLIPGVGISLAARCTSAHNLKEEDLLVLEKYERLAGVTRGLLACCEHPSLRSLIVTHHLGDLMAALSQICFAPLKKPIADQQNTDVSFNDEFVMTQELWNLFQQDRSYFRNCFVSFIWQVYQPFVIRELLLLHGAAGLKRIHTCNRTSPPSWLKRACIQLLVHCLMRPRGVSALIRAICDSSHDSGKDWSKLETVVGLVTTVHTTNPEQYYKNICSQILEMLSAGEKTYSHIQILVAVKCIEVIYKREPQLISQHFLGVLMDPLYRCGRQQVKETCKLDKEDSETIVSEEYLSRCIVNMHRVFVECCSVGSALSPSLFLPVSSILFQLYCRIYESPSFLVSKIEGLLVKYLANLETISLSDVFKNFLFGDTMNNVLLMDHNRLRFTFGPTGGVVVVVQKKDDGAQSNLHGVEKAADCLLHLLTAGDKTGKITTDLFMTLLQSLCDEPCVCGDDDSVNDGELLLSNNAFGSGERHYITIKLLSVLSNSPFIHERINNDPSYLIDYFLYILERDYKYLSNNDISVSEGDPAVEDLIMVIMTVAMALSNIGSKNESLEWEAFDRIVEPLKMIRDHVENEELKLLAGEVHNTIVTRGVIHEGTVQKCTQCSTKKSKVKEKVLRKMKKKSEKNCDDDICSNQVENPDVCSRLFKEMSSDNAQKYFKELNPYKEAILCACDPSIPVHGHGLLQLTKLVVCGDEDAKANKHIILKIFQDDLKYEDSFIYLLAIKGLAAMTDMCPENVIKVLVEEYLAPQMEKELQDLIELRLKIGEVLVKVSRSLDPTSSYVSLLLDAFLKGATDPEPLMRASSLSNLGQVCKTIGFRINTIIQEVLMCIQSIVESDTVDVCAAAVMVLTLLLQGLENDAFTVLGDELLEIYRHLKLLYSRSDDNSLKLHVQLALEEINKICREYIFPTQKMEKRLYILDAPPNS